MTEDINYRAEEEVKGTDEDQRCRYRQYVNYRAREEVKGADEDQRCRYRQLP